jgi:hypothetical protein
VLQLLALEADLLIRLAPQARCELSRARPGHPPHPPVSAGSARGGRAGGPGGSGGRGGTHLVQSLLAADDELVPLEAAVEDAQLE